MASGFFAAASPRSSRMRSKLSAAGGFSSSCDTARAAPVLAESHSIATLNAITSQPRPRRGSSSLAPSSVSSRKGTGGSTSAVITGFQDSMPSITRRLFTKDDPTAGSGGAIVPDDDARRLPVAITRHHLVSVFFR